MSKPVKYTVAVVLKKSAGSDEFLVVKRPDDDPELAGSWGLPAAVMDKQELPEDTAVRVCREKLNCLAVSTRFLGAMIQKRNAYDIVLMDIEMILSELSLVPDVKLATTTNTAYVAQKWTDDPKVLLESAKKGSCCSSILLADRGVLDRTEWVESLEDSNIVG